jgi:hypothetical protein
MPATAPNELLRAALTETRWTYEAAVRAVNNVAAERGQRIRTSPASLHQWLSGVSPRPATVVYLAEAFSRRLRRRVEPADLGYHVTTTPIDKVREPLASLTDLGRDDVDRRNLLTSAIYSLGALALPFSDVRPRAAHAARTGRQVGAADVDTVMAIARQFDSIDERYGGGTGREAVTAFLANDVAAFCAAASGRIRQDMFAAAVELAFLAGWKNHDLQREGTAQRYYLHAHDLACELADPSLRGHVMRILAHQALDLGHSTGSCLDLAETSTRLVAGRVDPHTEAVFTLTIARAHALAGDRHRTLEAINTAERLDARASEGDTRPDWPKMRNNRGQFYSHVAKSLVDIGDLAGAEHHFTLAWQERDPRTHTLISGLSQAWLAECQIKRGNIGAACANWAGAQQMLRGVSSQRASQCWRDMRALLHPYTGRRIPEVDALLRSPA